MGQCNNAKGRKRKLHKPEKIVKSIEEKSKKAKISLFFGEKAKSHKRKQTPHRPLYGGSMAGFPEQGSIYAGLPRGLQCLFLAPESTPDTQTADSTGQASAVTAHKTFIKVSL